LGGQTRTKDTKSGQTILQKRKIVFSLTIHRNIVSNLKVQPGVTTCFSSLLTPPSWGWGVTIEALISLISGLLSAFLVAWLKKKWDKKPVS
jgi:hypothetical protein